MATSALWALPVPSLSDPPNGPAQMLALANAIETAVAARYAPLAPDVWVNMTLVNGWVNFGAPLCPCQYRKNGDNVELRGVMKGGAMAAGAFNLPAGFRPPIQTPAFATTSNGAFASLYIQTDGAIVPNVGSPLSFALNCSFSTT